MRECNPLDWNRIAYEHDPWSQSRSPSMCFNRWTYVIEADVCKGPWSTEEDEAIIACMSSVSTPFHYSELFLNVHLTIHQGITKWSVIATHLPSKRLGKQVNSLRLLQ